MIFAYEVTELKQALQARDEFLSIASHELKTPITSLKLQNQMVLREMRSAVPGRDRLEKFLNVSAKQIDRLIGLIEDLLDVARIRAGKLAFVWEEFDLSELVEEVVERLRSDFVAANTPLIVRLDPGIRAELDRSRVEQIVVNLLTNALKYAPGKAVHVELSRVDGSAELAVRDQGPGIAAARHAKIFERFERVTSPRNVSGLGLGLYITRQIVEAHGGRILLESEEGRGADFRVRLPLRQARPEAPRAQSA